MVAVHKKYKILQRWQEFTNADSWNDIHIDPITIQFEGAAAMRS
jgi:hypothetical protein